MERIKSAHGALRFAMNTQSSVFFLGVGMIKPVPEKISARAFEEADVWPGGLCFAAGSNRSVLVGSAQAHQKKMRACSLGGIVFST